MYVGSLGRVQPDAEHRRGGEDGDGGGEREQTVTPKRAPPHRATLFEVSRHSSGFRGRPASVMVPGELEQQSVQDTALVGSQRCEKLLLDSLGDRAQAAELFRAGRSQADEVAPAVERVAPPLDEATLLEFVEEADQLAAVVAECIGDATLRLACTFVEERQHGVVLRGQPGLGQRLVRAVLDQETEPFEQEGRTQQQLPRRAGVSRGNERGA